jgi:hypothetical protein
MVEVKRLKHYVEHIYHMYNIWNPIRTKKKKQNRKDAPMGHKKIYAALHGIKIAKKKIKAKEYRCNTFR